MLRGVSALKKKGSDNKHITIGALFSSDVYSLELNI